MRGRVRGGTACSRARPHAATPPRPHARGASRRRSRRVVTGQRHQLVGRRGDRVHAHAVEVAARSAGPSARSPGRAPPARRAASASRSAWASVADRQVAVEHQPVGVGDQPASVHVVRRRSPRWPPCRPPRRPGCRRRRAGPCRCRSGRPRAPRSSPRRRPGARQHLRPGRVVTDREQQPGRGAEPGEVLRDVAAHAAGGARRRPGCWSAAAAAPCCGRARRGWPRRHQNCHGAVLPHPACSGRVGQSHAEDRGHLAEDGGLVAVDRLVGLVVREQPDLAVLASGTSSPSPRRRSARPRSRR